MEELEELFKQGEDIASKMKTLFLKNNLPTAHLEFLPKEDFEEWKILYEQRSVLDKKICSIINKK